MVTTKQAARMLECSVKRVRKMLNRGTLVGRTELDPKAGPYSGNIRWMIDRQSVEKAVALKEGE